MINNNYHFESHWRVRGTREEVFATLSDTADLARWWPAVYLSVVEREPGDAQGVGRVIDMYTKGWLPYTIKWQLRVDTINKPERVEIHAFGDLRGRGVWTLTQDGEFTNLHYDWQVQANKPLLRRLSWLLRPVFAANHKWAMRVGEESLKLELLRQRLPANQQSSIPAPPQPTQFPLLPLVVSLVGVVVLWQWLRPKRATA